MPRVTLHFTLRDNNGKEAEIRFNLRESVSFAQADDWVASLEAALIGISDADIVKAEFRVAFQLTQQTVAEPSSDCTLFLYLFLSNDDETYSIAMPSPRQLPVDLVGPYRDFRLGMAAFLLPNVQAFLDSVFANTVTVSGGSWPTTYRIGAYNRENP